MKTIFRIGLVLLGLHLCACSRQEPSSLSPASVRKELRARSQMERLNDIGCSFMDRINLASWKEEALFLDAAVASLKADDEWKDGAFTSFMVKGVPGEARLQINGPLSTVTLYRDGEVISTARFQEDGALDVQLQHYRYASGAPAEGLTMGSSTLWKEGQIIASMEVTPLGPGVAQVEAQVLDGEVRIRGTAQDAALQTLKLRLTPDLGEADGRALASDLDACLEIGLFYPEMDQQAAVIGIGPLHRQTRFDDYWTWQWELRFPDGIVTPVDRLTSYMEMQDLNRDLMSLRTQVSTILSHIYP